ncbi:MAG TPA: AmmeMemoRadiSam system radical SAM enzyme [Dehalococcoidia bacterium]|nr:AmmeMemoRadiSam system radical SAM enzyme [Dehalococcoidia bacterium]
MKPVARGVFPVEKEALFFQDLGDRIRCCACERRCELPPDASGFCQTRKNRGGKLYTLVYGDISSISANPIEKKPLFHFYPGSTALTVGTWSCNFTCPWCQNYEISKSPQSIGKGRYLSPEDFIELTTRYHCQGTSISLNEPTLLLEYSLDIFELAKGAGYYNTFVTNGYMTPQALQALIQHGLDAMNIDIKGDTEAVSRLCHADVAKVWRNAVEAKRHGVWVEITTLVIPGVNDKEETLRGIARKIKGELGDETPWHTTGYYPAYRFRDELFTPPTPLKSLEKAREIGKGEGLKYVYIGNVPGHPFESTYCPRCHELLVGRHGFSLTGYRITEDNRCPKCGQRVPIVGHPVKAAPRLG